MAVASKPGGTSFNPLLIYGGVGLGKTHLAHAIGVDIKDKYPEKTVLYISTEKFTQQYIDSVKGNSRNDFIHFYQMIDVLIVDDVQFLSGKNHHRPHPKYSIHLRVRRMNVRIHVKINIPSTDYQQ